MAVELEGLEFQIEAKSEECTKGIDALTASLGKLKQATKGGLGLNSKVKELNKLNEALKGFHTDKLESLGKALASLNGLGKTQISSTIPKRLNEIAQSLHEIGLADIERLEDLGKALRDLQEVGDVKIPKVTVPSAGVAPTMNGTTNAEAATSGVEQATSSVQETAHAVEQVTQKTGVLKSILGGIDGVFSKGFSVGTGTLHICKLSSLWRFLQVQYSLTDTGRVIQKINPKRLTNMRRKMKKLVHILTEKEFDDWYGSWFRNHYRIMSRLQRENMDTLYNQLKKEVYHNVQNHSG